MFSIVASITSPHQVQHQLALKEGLAKLGIESTAVYSSMSLDTVRVACWGWKMGKKLREEGHEVLVLERGYVGDRFKYTSLGWNGLNGFSTFPEYPDDGGQRFRDHGGVIYPWRKNKSYALILGQVLNDQSLRGIDIMPWYEEQAELIKKEYAIPVYFRPHPEQLRRGLSRIPVNCLESTGSLYRALECAAFSLCFNSNSSVDSVLFGTPCIVGDKGSMAYEVCGKNITEIIRPEREEWAHKLAWKQWTIDEIKSGEALKRLV